MKSLVLGLLAALVVSLGLVTVPTAATEPYPGSVATSASASGPSTIQRGHRPTSKVLVRAAGNAKPVGKIRVSYVRTRGGFSASKNIRYYGEAVSFPGPSLTRRGKYRVSTTFVPKKGSVWQRSATSYTLKVIK